MLSAISYNLTNIPFLIVEAVRAPTAKAPVISKTKHRSMACRYVTDREDTEVAQALATSSIARSGHEYHGAGGVERTCTIVERFKKRKHCAKGKNVSILGHHHLCGFTAASLRLNCSSRRIIDGRRGSFIYTHVRARYIHASGYINRPDHLSRLQRKSGQDDYTNIQNKETNHSNTMFASTTQSTARPHVGLTRQEEACLEKSGHFWASAESILAFVLEGKKRANE